MRLRRVLAAVVVSASACVALETGLSTTTQAVAIVNMDNPWTFTTTGEVHSFTVSVVNASDSDDIMSISPSSTNCGNFMVSPSVFPQHICGAQGMVTSGSPFLGCPKSYAFSVKYTGNINNEDCYINIGWSTSPGSAGSGSSGIAQLELKTNLATASLHINPTSIDFGQIPMGTPSSSQSMTLTNNGTVPLTVSGFLGGPGVGAYTVTPIAPATLASHTLNAGSADKYDVSCTPPAVQTYDAAVTFTAMSGTITQTSMFTCAGIVSSITIAPSQITFPSTLVGRAPPDQSITITGPAATTITGITLDATAMMDGISIVSSPPPGTVLGTGVTVTVHYAADTAHDAGPLGKLIVMVSSDTQPREVAISGEALPGSIGTNPAVADLGPICASGSGSVDVEVFANAAGTVKLDAPAQPGTPFAYTSTATFPATLRGGHLGGATLKVAAHSTTIGDVTGTLMLVTDIPNANAFPLPLKATVLADGVAATPSTVNFGTIDPNSATSGREITLTNCGTSNLQVSAASIIGTNAKEFVLVSPQDPAVTLKPTEHETFLVIMSSHDSTGDKSAVLHVEHDGGTTDADLAGSVVGANKDRETYYGCSVASGSSAGLVLGVSLLVRRRRRRVS